MIMVMVMVIINVVAMVVRSGTYKNVEFKFYIDEFLCFLVGESPKQFYKICL